jgi:hypothetical protein
VYTLVFWLIGHVDVEKCVFLALEGTKGDFNFA